MRPIWFYITHLFVPEAKTDGADDDEDDEDDGDDGSGQETVLKRTGSDVQMAPLRVERLELTVVLPAAAAVEQLTAEIEERTGLSQSEQLLLDTGSGAHRLNISSHAYVSLAECMLCANTKKRRHLSGTALACSV